MEGVRNEADVAEFEGVKKTTENISLYSQYQATELPSKN